MGSLIYPELKIQEYLISEAFSIEEKRILFHYRTRMANYSENFRGKSPSKPCKICLFHTDSQGHSVRCAETLKKVKTVGKYDEIFTNNISKETAQMLKEIEEYRSEYLEWEK